MSEKVAGLVLFLAAAMVVVGAISIAIGAYMRWGFGALAAVFIVEYVGANIFRWAWVRTGHRDFGLPGD